MKDQFARHGIPQELISDNGPAYTSKEFRSFSSAWGFRHITSSPNYPQSNGRSERTVRTVKSLLIKSLNDQSDLYIALLNYRTAPRDGIASPAQLLMGRRLNTRLPVSVYKLQPERDNTNDYTNILRKQINNKTWYDSRARELPDLNAGDRVITVEGANRREAYITGRCFQPRSYFITDERGKSFRRNRRHLIQVQQPESSSPTSRIEMANDDGDECSSESSVYGDPSEITDFDITTDPSPESYKKALKSNSWFQILVAFKEPPP